MADSPQYQGRSKAIHVTGTDPSVDPAWPDHAFPVYRGRSRAVRARSDSPSLDLRTITGPVRDSPQYKGRSEAIHVFGGELPAPPPPIPSCQCCAEACNEVDFDLFDRTLGPFTSPGSSIGSNANSVAWTTFASTGEYGVDGDALYEKNGPLAPSGPGTGMAFLGQLWVRSANPPGGNLLSLLHRVKVELVTPRTGVLVSNGSTLVATALNDGIGSNIALPLLFNDSGTPGVLGELRLDTVVIEANAAYDTWYLWRVELSPSVNRQKVWREGDPEPDWQNDRGDTASYANHDYELQLNATSGDIQKISVERILDVDCPDVPLGGPTSCEPPEIAHDLFDRTMAGWGGPTAPTNTLGFYWVGGDSCDGADGILVNDTFQAHLATSTSGSHAAIQKYNIYVGDTYHWKIENLRLAELPHIDRTSVGPVGFWWVGLEAVDVSDSGSGDDVQYAVRVTEDGGWELWNTPAHGTLGDGVVLASGTWTSDLDVEILEGGDSIAINGVATAISPPVKTAYVKFFLLGWPGTGSGGLLGQPEARLAALYNLEPTDPGCVPTDGSSVGARGDCADPSDPDCDPCSNKETFTRSEGAGGFGQSEFDGTPSWAASINGGAASVDGTSGVLDPTGSIGTQSEELVYLGLTYPIHVLTKQRILGPDNGGLTYVLGQPGVAGKGSLQVQFEETVGGAPNPFSMHPILSGDAGFGLVGATTYPFGTSDPIGSWFWLEFIMTATDVSVRAWLDGSGVPSYIVYTLPGGASTSLPTALIVNARTTTVGTTQARWRIDLIEICDGLDSPDPDAACGGCTDCEDPNNPGEQRLPFTPGFLPVFRRQIGDPTTTLDSHICTMECGAMGLEWETRGAVSVWGGELIPWSGRTEASIAASGSNLNDVARAWLHWGRLLTVRSGQTWSHVMSALGEGRAVLLQGDYGQFSLAERCQDSFEGNHCIILLPSIVSGRILTGDPLCSTWHGRRETSLQAYAEAFGAAVFGTTSPQKILFAVSSPWII